MNYRNFSVFSAAVFVALALTACNGGPSITEGNVQDVSTSVLAKAYNGPHADLVKKEVDRRANILAHMGLKLTGRGVPPCPANSPLARANCNPFGSFLSGGARTTRVGIGMLNHGWWEKTGGGKPVTKGSEDAKRFVRAFVEISKQTK